MAPLLKYFQSPHRGLRRQYQKTIPGPHGKSSPPVHQILTWYSQESI